MKIDHIPWNKGITHTPEVKKKIGLKRVEYFNSLPKYNCKIEGCDRLATIPRGKKDPDLQLCVNHRIIEHRKVYYKMHPDKEIEAKKKEKVFKKNYVMKNKKGF